MDCRNRRSVISMLMAATTFHPLAHAVEALPDLEFEKQLLLDEIVVTARKREESLQQSPVAISAFDDESLQRNGIKSMRDLFGTVPGLSFNEQGTKGISINLRGVGQKESLAALDPSVGVYINGVYIPRTDTQLFDTVDTETVQVLRGPQGTLFGKNTTGGAILVTTRSPYPDEFSADVGTRIGNFGRRDARVGVNVPLLDDQLSMRAAVNSVKRDGYLENVTGDRDYGDEDRLAATARIVWQPISYFSGDLFLYFSRQNENGLGANCLLANPEGRLTGTLAYPPGQDFQAACRTSEEAIDDGKVAMGNRSAFRLDNQMVALTLAWDLDPVELKSVTGVSWQDNVVIEDDMDASAAEVLQNGSLTLKHYLEQSGIEYDDETRDQISQEFNLVGNAWDERLSYTLGVFYSVENVDNTPYAQAIGPGTFASVAALPGIAVHKFLGTQSDLESETSALYGQTTFDFTQWFELTLGARFTEESRERDLRVYSVDLATLQSFSGGEVVEGTGINYGSAAALDAAYQRYLAGEFYIPIQSAGTDSGKETWHKFTPAITAAFTNLQNYIGVGAFDSLMTYITVSDGFKSGGLEPKGAELVAFDPEVVRNYEIGTKLEALDHRLRMNLALYYMDYDDIQVRVAAVGAGPTDINLYLSNAAEATIKGGELEIFVLPIEHFTVGLTFNYTDAGYDEYTSPESLPDLSVGDYDRSHEPLNGVPRKTSSLMLAYDVVTESAGVWTPMMSIFYRDAIYIGLDYTAADFKQSTLGEYTLLNLRLNWKADRHWTLAAFVDNALDEEYMQGGFAVTQALGTAVVVQGPPRTYGMEASYEF